MRLEMRPKLLLLLVFALFLAVACNQDSPDGDNQPEEGQPTETAEVNTAETEERPTETAEVNIDGVEFVPFSDDELGMSAEYPSGWVTQSAFGGATFATSQAVIDAESLADIGEEGFVVVIPGEIEYFNFQTEQSFTEDDVLSALATYKILLEREGQQYVTQEPPQAYANDNQKLARMTLRSIEDGAPLITIMAVVMQDGYMALISAASLEDTAQEMRPIFNYIIESVEVRPPGVLNVEE